MPKPHNSTAKDRKTGTQLSSHGVPCSRSFSLARFNQLGRSPSGMSSNATLTLSQPVAAAAGGAAVSIAGARAPSEGSLSHARLGISLEDLPDSTQK